MGDKNKHLPLVTGTMAKCLMFILVVALAAIASASPLPNSLFLDPTEVVGGIQHMDDYLARAGRVEEDRYDNDAADTVVPMEYIKAKQLQDGFIQDESPEFSFIQVPTTEMLQQEEGRRHRRKSRRNKRHRSKRNRRHRSKRNRRKRESRLRKKARHQLENEDAVYYHKLHNDYMEHGGFGMKPHKGKIKKGHKHFPRDQCVLHCMSSHVAAYSNAPTSVVVPSSTKCEGACAKLGAQLEAAASP